MLFLERGDVGDLPALHGSNNFFANVDISKVLATFSVVPEARAGGHILIAFSSARTP